MIEPHILVINPGSTSTKVSLFEGEQEIFTETIEHRLEDLARFNRASDQDLYRMELIIESLQRKKIEAGKIKAIVGRGGLLKPIFRMLDSRFKVRHLLKEGAKIRVQNRIRLIQQRHFWCI